MNKLYYLCGALLVSANALATELVVLESTSARYEPGETITDEETIALDEGTDIVLLSEDGIVIAVVGPFDGPLVPIESEDDYDILRTLGVLVGQSEVDTRSIGGVRAGYDDEVDPLRDVPDTRESPWQIHTGVGGSQCLPASVGTAALWREVPGRAQHLAVHHLASGNAATVNWPAGEKIVPWPSELALERDAVYVLRKDDELRSVALMIRTVPDTVVENGFATVAWLAARDCANQARLALNLLR